KFEKNVFHDMIDQQRWTILLNSYMAMLKCRFPYTDVSEVMSNLDYNIDEIQDHIEIINKKDDQNAQMLYLAGDCYLQISPPMWSTETRLIIKREENQKYQLKYYDVKKYESQLLYYNLFDRIKSYQYRDSEQLKYHLMGFDDSH